MFFTLVRSFLRRRDGTVSIFGAIALPMLVAFASLVVEFGHGLLAKAEIQRIADLASYAGGLAYTSSSSTTTMAAAAKNVAALNGVSASAVTVSLITSPKNAADNAVMVSIAETQMLLLAPIVNFGSSVPIGAKSYSQLGVKTSACVIALSTTGGGVNMAGATSIAAPTCGVGSNANVTAPCGTTITDAATTYNGTLSAGCSNIIGLQAKTTVADPLATNPGVLALSAHVSAVNGLSSPSPPSIIPAADLYFGSTIFSTPAATLTALLSQSCIAVGPVFGQWVITCPLNTVISFGTVTVASGVTVSFNPLAILPTTYNFSGSLVNNSTINFGPGTFNIAQGIFTAGGATTTFGAGTFTIGSEPTTCVGGAGKYSVCNLGTTTFAGSSTFVLSSGIYNTGGSTISLGANTTANSFQIGQSSDGYALNVGGGSTTTLGDATTGLFQIVGNIYAPSGGSCMTIGKAPQHDINGNISTAGGLIFGSGIYTVSGYIGMGYVSGGNTTCGGVLVGTTGSGVTFVTGASSTMTSTNCPNAAFCISSGFNNVSLSAPTTGPYANLLIIGPMSYNTSGIALTEGYGGSTLNGAIYFPYGAMILAGSASMAPSAGQCLQVIASQISFTGSGTIAASTCFSGSASTWNVAIVQ